jgi:hypothetical protein
MYFSFFWICFQAFDFGSSVRKYCLSSGAIVQPILKTLPERGTTYSSSTRGNGWTN